MFHVEQRPRPWERAVSAAPSVADWRSAFEALCSALALDLPEACCSALVAHAQTLWQFNPRLNLTSLTTPHGVVSELFGDSLLGLRLAPMLRTTHLVDIGSGGGFPGLPLAVACPAWTCELLERKSSIALYLEQAVQATGAGHVTVLNVSLEEYPQHRKDPEPICFTAKAVFHVEQLCARLAESGRPLDQACWWGLPGLTADRLPPPWRIEAQESAVLPGSDRPTAIYLLTQA